MLFLYSHAVVAGETGRLTLSASESQILSSIGNVRLAVDIDWAPFEFVDAEKNYRGMAAEYIALVEQRLGITFAVDKDRPWPKMVEAVQNRDLDAFSLVVRTPQRDEFVNFTKPYVSFPMVIVTRENESYVDGLRALRNRTVAVVESYASHELLSRNHPNLKLHIAPTAKSGLEAVALSQADAFVGNLAVASQVMREYGVTNLKISGQTKYRFELAMAVRKDWPELVPLLQKALDSITHEERDAIYNRWIRVKFEETVDYRIILSVIAAGALIVLITLFWNRRLKREMSRRRNTERHIRALFNNVVDGIVAYDRNGTVNRINPAGERILGYDWHDLVGKEIDQFIPALKHVHGDDAKHDETDGGSEAEALRRDGTRFPIELALSGATVEGQSMSVCIFRDITERKEIERLKSQFVSTVSHELRTPLTSIRGALGLLSSAAGEPMPDELRSLVDIAYRNSDRLALLVDDILDLEKLDSGLTTFEMAPIDVKMLIEEAREANQGYSEQQGARIKVFTVPPSVFIEGDYHRLQQVMSNILSNAAKFSPQGADIEIWVNTHDDRVEICIKDYGPGIPEGFQDKLYDRFTQADNSDERQKGGTGLGMSITKTIVEAHNGEIRFETGPNTGTTFFVSLPTCNSVDHEASQDMHRSAKSEARLVANAVGA